MGEGRISTRGTSVRNSGEGWWLSHDNTPSLYVILARQRAQNDKNTFLVPYCLSNLVSSKKAAFTLAEVLITLGIIGIVAAMTIPTLISNYQEKATVTKLKETYSMLSQAYQFAVNENGSPASWKFGIDMYDQNAHVAMANYFKPYLKLSADCVGKSKEYVIEHCSSIFPEMSVEKNATAMRLNNGSTLYFRIFMPDCTGIYASATEKSTCGWIIVLTNPMKSSERGKDTFYFYLTTKGIIPAGSVGSRLVFERACNPEIDLPYPTFSANNMYACAAWVIYNNNMDYWKCPGELSWAGKHSCDD